MIKNCQISGANVFIAANGNAPMLYPPDLGIRGNTHMIMQDWNNLEIADMILKWLDEGVGEADAR